MHQAGAGKRLLAVPDGAGAAAGGTRACPDPFAPQPNVGVAPPPRGYAELQCECEARINEYTAELERLYARYQELEEQKRPLLEQVGALRW